MPQIKLNALHSGNEVFLDVGQVAIRWHCASETVRRRIRRGELSATRVGRRLLISRVEVERTESAGARQ